MSIIKAILRDICVEIIKDIVETTHKRLDSIEQRNKEIDLKYSTWLEEKALWEKELKDKIMKRVNYINQKENSMSIKEQVKTKTLQRMGLLPKAKDINTLDETGVQNE